MRLWLGTLRQWHWISSALCLAGMLLFAVTGITLNHAGQIEGKAQVSSRIEQLPKSLQELLLADAPVEGVPTELAEWLEDRLGIRPDGARPNGLRASCTSACRAPAAMPG